MRHQLLIEAVDIVHGTLGFCGFIPIFVDNENDSSVNKSSCPCRWGLDVRDRCCLSILIVITRTVPLLVFVLVFVFVFVFSPQRSKIENVFWKARFLKHANLIISVNICFPYYIILYYRQTIIIILGFRDYHLIRFTFDATNNYLINSLWEMFQLHIGTNKSKSYLELHCNMLFWIISVWSIFPSRWFMLDRPLYPSPNKQRGGTCLYCWGWRWTSVFYG